MLKLPQDSYCHSPTRLAKINAFLGGKRKDLERFRRVRGLKVEILADFDVDRGMSETFYQHNPTHLNLASTIDLESA